MAVRDEAKEMWRDARPQARKNRRRIHWNTLRIFQGREQRRWSWIIRRSRTVNVGQAPKRVSQAAARNNSEDPRFWSLQRSERLSQDQG